jgi:hypothetical protein
MRYVLKQFPRATNRLVQADRFGGVTDRSQAYVTPCAAREESFVTVDSATIIIPQMFALIDLPHPHPHKMF